MWTRIRFQRLNLPELCYKLAVESNHRFEVRSEVDLLVKDSRRYILRLRRSQVTISSLKGTTYGVTENFVGF